MNRTSTTNAATAHDDDSAPMPHCCSIDAVPPDFGCLLVFNNSEPPRESDRAASSDSTSTSPGGSAPGSAAVHGRKRAFVECDAETAVDDAAVVVQQPPPSPPPTNSAHEALSAYHARVLEAASAELVPAPTADTAVIQFVRADFVDSAAACDEYVPRAGERYERVDRSDDEACARWLDSVWAFYVHESKALLGSKRQAQSHNRAAALARLRHLPTRAAGKRGDPAPLRLIDARTPLLCAVESHCSVDALPTRQVLFVGDFSELAAMPRWHCTQSAVHAPPVLDAIELCVIDARHWSDRTLCFLRARQLLAPHHWIKPFLDTCMPLVAEARQCEDDELSVKFEAEALAWRLIGVRPALVTWGD